MNRLLTRTRGCLILLLSAQMLLACRPSEPESSEAKIDAGCIGNYLGQFIEGIPLPGFSALGKIGASIAGNVAGILRNKVADEVQATCAAPATFERCSSESFGVYRKALCSSPSEVISIGSL